MNCPRCGTEVTEGAAFCWSCEAPLHNLKPPPAPVAPPRADEEGSLRDPYAGKNEQILGFAIFMFGMLWSCGATAGSRELALANYTLPIVLVLVGAGLWIFGRLKSRRRNE